MKLCLDIGNTHLFGGVFSDNKLILKFRHSTQIGTSSDQLGLFLKAVLRENDIDPKLVQHIAICSVVPAFDYTVRAACNKYFQIDPLFLQPGVKTGLKIKYRNPLEVGADRISNAIAAINQFPNKNIFIVDFGTATTCCVVTKQAEYYGGAILPGLKLSMEALQNNTAKLFPAEIIKPKQPIGQSTAESLQAGIYYAQLGAVKELLKQAQTNEFSNEEFIVIATGGFAHLFTNENCFNLIADDLVLQGLNLLIAINAKA